MKLSREQLDIMACALAAYILELPRGESRKQAKELLSQVQAELDSRPEEGAATQQEGAGS